MPKTLSNSILITSGKLYDDSSAPYTSLINLLKIHSLVQFYAQSLLASVDFARHEHVDRNPQDYVADEQ